MATTPLTTADVAERLNITERRVRALLKARRLTGTRVGRDWLISETDLRKFSPQPPGRPRQAS